MKRRTIILFCVLLQLVLLVVALAFVIQSYLNSRRFQSLIVQELSNYVECEVRLGQMKNGVLSGLDMRNVVLTSPDVTPHRFLMIQRARIRYDLSEALFHQRIVIVKVSLDEPVLELDLTEPFGKSGRRLAHRNAILSDACEGSLMRVDHSAPVPTDAVMEAPVFQSGPSLHSRVGWPAPPAMDLKGLWVQHGMVTLHVAHGQTIVAHEVEVKASLSSTPVPSGVGAISCETLDLPEDFRLNSASVSLLWRRDTLTIPNFSADLFGGRLDGDFKADQTKPGIPFDLQLKIQNIETEEVLEKVRWTEGDVRGRLQSSSSFKGLLVSPELASGEGQLEVDDAHLVNVSFLALLGGYLNRSDLRNLPLQVCGLDFNLKARRFSIPRFQIQSADLAFLGNGWIQFPNQTQEFWFKCALADKIATQIPPQMVSNFTKKTDGSGEISVHTWGRIHKPETDLELNLSGARNRAIGGAIFDQIFEAIPKGKDESH